MSFESGDKSSNQNELSKIKAATEGNGDKLADALKLEECSLFPKEVEEMSRIVRTSDFYKRITVKTWSDEENAEYNEKSYVYDEEKNAWMMDTIAHYQGSYQVINEGEAVQESDFIKEFANLSPDTDILLQPLGTHVGSLKFEPGRAHKNSEKDNANEALIPQTLL